MIIFDVAFTIASSIVVGLIPLSVNRCLKWRFIIITFISVSQIRWETIFRIVEALSEIIPKEKVLRHYLYCNFTNRTENNCWISWKPHAKFLRYIFIESTKFTYFVGLHNVVYYALEIRYANILHCYVIPHVSIPKYWPQFQEKCLHWETLSVILHICLTFLCIIKTKLKGGIWQWNFKEFIVLTTTGNISDFW